MEHEQREQRSRCESGLMFFLCSAHELNHAESVANASNAQVIGWGEEMGN